MMNRIYLDAKDKYVGNYVLYGNSEDNKLYYESAHEHQVTEADLVDAFMKGALVIAVGAEYFAPVSISANTVNTVGAGATLVAWSAAVNPQA